MRTILWIKTIIISDINNHSFVDERQQTKDHRSHVHRAVQLSRQLPLLRGGSCPSAPPASHLAREGRAHEPDHLPLHDQRYCCCNKFCRPLFERLGLGMLAMFCQFILNSLLATMTREKGALSPIQCKKTDEHLHLYKTSSSNTVLAHILCNRLPTNIRELNPGRCPKNKLRAWLLLILLFLEEYFQDGWFIFLVWISFCAWQDTSRFLVTVAHPGFNQRGGWLSCQLETTGGSPPPPPGKGGSQGPSLGNFW